MITIYHNPRCSKSRGACDLVANVYNEAKEPVDVVEYLKNPLTVSELKQLNKMLACPVRYMLRAEPAYKDLGLADPALLTLSYTKQSNAIQSCSNGRSSYETGEPSLVARRRPSRCSSDRRSARKRVR